MAFHRVMQATDRKPEGPPSSGPWRPTLPQLRSLAGHPLTLLDHFEVTHPETKGGASHGRVTPAPGGVNPGLAKEIRAFQRKMGDA